MTDIDDAIDDVRDAAADFLNSEGRSAGHVALGVALTVGFALLATGIGLFAAIPAVIFYNYFNTRISNYGTRSDGFNAELINSISRQLDRGA